MDIVQLYKDYRLDFKQVGEHKHVRSGFVNVECPFCVGNPGYHLSYHLENEYFICWRCGFKHTDFALSTLLNTSIPQAREIAKNYGSIALFKPVLKKRYNTKDFILPAVVPLTGSHKKYLEKRNFDPDKLEYEWDLMSTTPTSKVENLNYKHRILIPFIWEGVLVTFDSRDTTGKAMNKYMACPLEHEIIPHKNILYGKQSKWEEKGIAVEGPTDVWRFGTNAFATSGIKFTIKQLREISKLFKRVAVCFDGGEPQALEQANLLVSELKFRGVDSFRVDIEGDPGSMGQNEADYLVKQLIK